jgi:hypothetical protein
LTEQTITHPELVRALVKPGADILSGLTAETADLWHAGTGVATEASEICLALLEFHNNRELDLENLVEELGDMEFYLQQLRTNLGVARDEVIEADIPFMYSPEPIEMAAVISVAGGDILDLVKKVVVYQKPVDRDAFIAVLAKLEGPLMVIRHMTGVEQDDVLAANIAKLSVRYAGLTYTDADAQARADKA